MASEIYSLTNSGTQLLAYLGRRAADEPLCFLYLLAAGWQAKTQQIPRMREALLGRTLSGF
jgi:uncharacterized protein YfiM (DUF2279 family)